ncbi:MAG: 50S ribosomal protein L4 [Patescibacteria group bacterium]|nr:50S ribosomal protein L4 [Patescibacteria group bacterium]
MTKLDILSTSAKKISTITVKDKIFKAKINSDLMNQAVRVYLSNQRSASARTKDRNQIKVTHAKVWRQKGTGRARHGSRNAPIFVGGSKTHGPSGFQTFSLKMPQKMKQLSLFSALTVKLKESQLLVVDGLEKIKPSTKAFDKIFNALVKQPKKLLLLIDKPQPDIKRGVNNLQYLNLGLAASLNTYQVLNSQYLIFTKAALINFEDHYVA